MIPAALLGILLLDTQREAMARVAQARATELGRTRLSDREAGRLAGAVMAAGRRHGLAPAVILGLIEVESAYRAGAVSAVGAVGLTQVLPATAAETARRLGRRRYVLERIEDSVAIGAGYLTWLVARLGRLDAALTAYNEGLGRWEHRRRVSDYARSVIDHAKLIEKRLTNVNNPT